MQNSDIEIPRNGRGVIGGEVIGNISLPEALAVQDHANLWKCKCLRLFGGKGPDVGWEKKFTGDLAFGIVITVKKEDGDPGLRKASHLFYEEKSCPVVLPVSVIEVSRNDREGDLLIDGQADQVLEGFPGGSPNSHGTFAFLTRQTPERTVKVDVRRVKKAKVRQGDLPSRRVLEGSANPVRMTWCFSRDYFLPYSWMGSLDLGQFQEGSGRREKRQEQAGSNHRRI